MAPRAPQLRISTLGTLLLCILSITSAPEARAGAIYVHTVSTDGESVYGWLVDEGSGRLVPIAGSPFAVTGSGVPNSSYVPIDSDTLAIDSVNDRLFALSLPADRIDAFAIDPATGALAPLAFGPQPVGGTSKLSGCVGIHPSGSPLVVLSGSVSRDATSYDVTDTTFTEISSSSYPTGSQRCRFTPTGDRVYFPTMTGSRTHVLDVDAGTGILSGGATIVLPEDPFVGIPIIDADDRLFIADSSTESIRGYTLAGAVATPVDGSPFESSVVSTAVGTLLLDAGHLVVLDTLEDRVAMFRIDGSAAATVVTETPGSPYASAGESPRSAVANDDGSLLFVLNLRGPNRLGIFRVDAPGDRLLEVGLLPPDAFEDGELVMTVRYWSRDVCGSPPDADADGVGDACDLCPGLDNSADGDGDGTGDCEDLCTDAGPRALDARTKLRFKSIGTDGVLGNDRFVVKGSFHLVAPATFGDLDPLTDLTRVEGIDAHGGRIIEAALEAGAFGGRGTAGWRVNGAGTVWKYRDKRDVPGPITAMALKDKSKKEPGLVLLKVSGKNATYFVDEGDEPVDVSLAFGDPADGLCTYTSYQAADCRFTALGSTLRCRGE
jgi:hypothetical protein